MHSESRELDITAMGARGEGVTESAGARIFVPFTLPGERVRAELEGGRGQLVEVLTPSPERIAPSCSHFGACGGCQLQHWEIEAYRAWKRELVVASFARAGIDTDVGALIAAWGNGRRRATLHARQEGAGFNAIRSHRIHPIEACPILVPELAEAPAIARACFDVVGNCDVQATATLGGIDIAVTGKHRDPYRGLTEVGRRFRLPRIAFNGEPVIVTGPVEIEMGKAHVELPVGGFLQATAEAEQVLAGLVLEGVGKAKAVADLFCGVGPFALRIAERAKIFAADSDRAAVAACDAALRRTPGLKVMGTAVRDLFRDPMVAQELKPFDAVVFDPPRAGAEAQARELALSRIGKVIAVSCDPATLARDAAILIAGGYRLESVTPVDQFAWSAHVETVAVFRK